MLVKYYPEYEGIAAIQPFYNPLDSFFKDVFGLKSVGAYRTDETETEIKFEFDVTGVPKNKIDVEVVNKTLMVRAKTERRNYYYSVYVPEPIDAESISAKSEDGVLIVVLKKNPPKKSKVLIE